MKEYIKKTRQTNIEFLRIIAMFMILILHADIFSLGAPKYNDIQNDTLRSFLIIFFESISIVSVNVFVLISGWFGIKPSFKGLCNFLFQCLFFLVTLYMLTLIFGFESLSLKGIAGCFFATELNWFIKAYLLLYILSPVLNSFITHSTKEEYKWVMIGFYTFTCTYGWINAASFMCSGLSTIFFIGLYLLGRYMRLYSPQWTKWPAKNYILQYASITILVTLIMFIPPLLVDINIPGVFWNYLAPTTIIGAVTLFLYFTKLTIQNRFINWCGISCFAVYLIHCSPYTLYHYKDFFSYLNNNLGAIQFWLATFGVLTTIFIIAILIDKIRIFIWNKVWERISKKHLKHTIE